MEKTYYIFGEAAVRAYDDNEDDVLQKIDEGGVLHVHDPNTQTAADLMEAYDGWQGYIEITKDEYEKFNAELEMLHEGN